MSYLFTSESVSEGHPDKLSDQISDGILDNFLAFDPNSKVACETLVTTGQVILSGEVTSSTYIDVQDIARNVIKDIGYNNDQYKFSGESCAVMSLIHEQSEDILRGVERNIKEEQGAGDQGIMFALTTRIKMDNMAGEILPGSFLEISIKYDIRDGLSAPDTSTIVEGENVYIYKVDEKNKVIKTKVTIGDRYLGFVEILDGLNNGDKIVAEGTKKVRPNLTIRPIEKGSNKKQENSSWGKKKESKNTGEKKGKFDWIKNIFKKSDKEKK